VNTPRAAFAFGAIALRALTGRMFLAGVDAVPVPCALARVGWVSIIALIGWLVWKGPK